MDKQKVYCLLLSELSDFVRNKAKPGDIAMGRDPVTEYLYMYRCTTENIGKNVNPIWVRVDEKALWRDWFNTMTLEEKVNFLIEKYTQSIT